MRRTHWLLTLFARGQAFKVAIAVDTNWPFFVVLVPDREGREVSRRVAGSQMESERGTPDVVTAVDTEMTHNWHTSV